MTTLTGTPGNDFREIAQSATFVYDGLGGLDVLSLGREPRTSFRITRQDDGGVRVDSVSTASGGGLQATLYNVERLEFAYRSDFIDLGTYFKPREVTGTAGNDRLPVAGQDRVFDGGPGVDTAVLDGARVQYTLTRDGADWLVAPAAGGRPNRLTGVERVVFDDRKIALDLDGDAGLVARILGAVFGAPSVADPALVGIGLQFTDAGLSPPALVQLALEARLGVQPGHAAVVDLLYANVVGSRPSPAERDAFVALLDNGSMTPAGLGLMAAQHELNLKFALVGLAQTGLDFA